MTAAATTQHGQDQKVVLAKKKKKQQQQQYNDYIYGETETQRKIKKNITNIIASANK